MWPRLKSPPRIIVDFGILVYIPSDILFKLFYGRMDALLSDGGLQY